MEAAVMSPVVAAPFQNYFYECASCGSRLHLYTRQVVEGQPMCVCQSAVPMFNSEEKASD